MPTLILRTWSPTTAVLEARIGKILRTTAGLWLPAASGLPPRLPYGCSAISLPAHRENLFHL